jgi:hypothetical protein
VSPTSGATLNILDPYLYAGDPRPAYQWLRDNAPVYWDPVNQIWGISRHIDVLAVERDTARYSSASGSRPLIEMTASMSSAGFRNDDPRQPAGSPEAIGEFVAAFSELIEARVAGNPAGAGL